MPLYQYEAKDIRGALVKGKMEAIDEVSVKTALRERNYFIVKIKEHDSSSKLDLTLQKKVTIKDIAIFCRQFAVTLAAGISILRAMEIVREQTENKRLKKILSEVTEDIQKGRTLSEGMGKHKEFPDMFVNMIGVGEVSGTLDTIAERMAQYYDKEYKLNQKIKQAMTYPAVISIFSIAVVILLVIKVLPTFVDMIGQSGGELPLSTKLVMGLSNILINNWILIVIAILILAMLVKAYFSTSDGKLIVDRAKLNMPLFGKVYKKIVTARFARTFGMLVSSGLSLIESIEICGDVVGNSIVKGILISLNDEIRKGTSIGDGLSNSTVFPVMLTQMIKIGEESGTLDSILERTAEFYDGEVEAATGQLTAMIEPVIIIFLSVAVGFLIISIITPIFQMYNSVNAG